MKILSRMKRSPRKKPARPDDAVAMVVPKVDAHLNRLPFEGCLTLVDVASDKAPSGARGHRVILSHGAARAALPGLIGMAVDYKAGWDGHDSRQKCGLITEAVLTETRLMVKGFIYCRDYPEIQLQKGELGMSYELAEAHVKDMCACIWLLTKVTFTGAAILLRKNAAYRETSFTLSAACPKKKASEGVTLCARPGRP